MKAICLEVRERRDLASKVKIRYEHLVKSLGDIKTFDEESKIPSHAYHLVQLAQDKAELVDQSQTLVRRLETEERELLGLRQAKAMMMNSNEKYRYRKSRRAGYAS